MYAKCFKRIIDFTLSLIALAILLPVLLLLAIIGAIAMKGNPFFVQPRPGKKDKNGKEKIFKLIKFRTMSNQKDKNGNLLPDDARLNKYGKFLRSTSLDELPELLNILKGDMAIVGPRPLLVSYLPYYTEEERKRHDVRPGLTGLAQVSGRNTVSWEKRFELDVEYRDNITFMNDVKIIINTVKAVLSHDSIELNALENFDEYRKKQADNADTDAVVGTIQK
ncbi:MAG: sugar transferase [Ruminococcaceae bacterium]|nr:sugar transferase [Oscillospiraceae bacterium]